MPLRVCGLSFDNYEKGLLITLLSPVHHNYASEGAKAEHPEPEENVDFLVEDVERQDAECVVLLQLPTRPKLVECTLRQPGENHDIALCCDSDDQGLKVIISEQKGSKLRIGSRLPDH